jgi:molybdopterin/thiamine biosynthesis adenylyltransferase
MVELNLIKHVFQNHNILCVQRDIVTVTPLKKEVLHNQNDTDILVMAAFRK